MIFEITEREIWVEGPNTINRYLSLVFSVSFPVSKNLLKIHMQAEMHQLLE
jgi:hypothetical protein